MAELTDDRWSEDVFIAEDQFLQYFGKNFLSDVTFIVGKDRERFPAHKFILSHCSYEFFNVFNNVKLDKDEFLIEGVEETDFFTFLRFCYTGKVEVNYINIWAVLKLAQRFQVKQLIGKCETTLIKNMKSIHCYEYLNKSSFLSQDSTLKKTILQQIENHFDELIDWETLKERFNNLSLKALGEIVDMETLKCNEMEIFDKVMNWAKSNCEKLKIPSNSFNFRLILGDVFCKIRFPTMKPEWFIEILSEYPNLFTRQEIIEISRVMKSEDKSNSKFPHKLRNYGNAFVRDPFPFISGLIKCFPGDFHLSNDSTCEMAIRFKGILSDKRRKFFGFMFIAKKNQFAEIISCTINEQVLKVDILNKKYLSWDYNLVIVRIDKVTLKENRWYELYCKIDGQMMNVKSDPPNYVNDLMSDGIQISKGKYNIIPYLWFPTVTNINT